MTFILLRANRDLAALADVLGESRAEIDSWTQMLIAGSETLKTPEGHYTAINLRSGAHTGHITNASFLNWYAGIESPEMMAELQAAFAASPYPVPSHKVGAAEFDSKRYWLSLIHI